MITSISFSEASEPPEKQAAASRESERLRVSVVANWAFVARLLRHLGVRRDLDDACQEVFLVLAKKLSLVEPSRERSFLAGCATHVAARARRDWARRDRRDTTDFDELPSTDLDPEKEVEHRRRLALLDQILGTMSEELRSVFVLYEIEAWTMKEISEALGVRPGTIASRLRRAREHFERRAAS